LRAGDREPDRAKAHGVPASTNARSESQRRSARSKRGCRSRVRHVPVRVFPAGPHCC
jgi:hypothetical protein